MKKEKPSRAIQPLPSDATDEGIPFAYLDHETIVNLSGDWYDQRRRELHVAGKSFSHVAEAAAGRVYRYDR